MDHDEDEWEDIEEHESDISSPGDISRGNDRKSTNNGCDFCRDIINYACRFRRLDEENFLSDIPQFHTGKEDTRGHLAERSETCSICAMAFYAILGLPSDPRRQNVNEEIDPYKSEVWWEFGRPRSRFARPMLCIVDSGHGSVMFKFREPLWVFLQDNSVEPQSDAEQNKYVSYEYLKRWYQKCLSHGGSLQELSLIDDLQAASIRLIDVQNNCLCDVPTSKPYLALSYVWGTTPGGDDKLMTTNIQQLYAHEGIGRTLKLSPTMRDACEVTQNLGFQYLFIDRLCIIQDSDEDMATYVNAMHEIYNKAAITIVAAAGKDAQAGLPGTRGTPRTQERLYHPRQRLEVLNDAELVQVHDEEFPPQELLEKYLEESVWMTRGWTYQEYKLSERMLIFTPKVVFWKCNHICLYEDCPHDQHEHLSDGLVNMSANDPFGRDPLWWPMKKMNRLEINGQKTTFDNLQTALQSVEPNDAAYNKKRDLFISVVFRSRIEEFRERHLTYDADIARAFNGMIAAFKMIHDPLPILHGLLTRSLPSELTWACAACAEKKHDNHKKHLGLRNVTDSSGVPLFPTWSWYAWQDRPTWFYHKRGGKEAHREMDEKTAMATSVYTGVSTGQGTTCIYWEKRQLHPRIQINQFVPPPSVAQHPLRERALIFIALVKRCIFDRTNPPPPTPSSPLERLSHLGLHFPTGPDAYINVWLQRPSSDTFTRPTGVVCLTSFSEEFRPNLYTRWAVLVLLSYRLIDGRNVAFREGLFTCEYSKFRLLDQYFTPEVVFLC